MQTVANHSSSFADNMREHTARRSLRRAAQSPPTQKIFSSSKIIFRE